MANRKINNIRRKLMRGITKGLGKAKSAEQLTPENAEVKNILVSRPNHRLGNLLMITPLLQELQTTFPEAKVDLFVKGGLPLVLFKRFKNVDTIISLPKEHFKQLGSYIISWFKLKRKKYDLVINVVEGSSSGRLSTSLARGTFKIGEEEADHQHRSKDYKHMAKNAVYRLREYMTEGGFPEVHRPVPSLSLMLNAQEMGQSKTVLNKIVSDATAKTIGIFTYATGGKRHSKAWWISFYNSLQKQFPSYNIVEILPKENVSQIDFKAPTYYSRDIREICAFIANTEIFIGADSGMMHLAVASKTPVIGLFSVTDAGKYEPYGSGSMAVNTKAVSQAEIIQKAKEILRESHNA